MVHLIAARELRLQVVGEVRAAIPDALQPARQGDSLPLVCQEIDVVTAICAGQLEGRPPFAASGRQGVDRLVELPHLHAPPREVPPAIPARHAVMGSKREASSRMGPPGGRWR